MESTESKEEKKERGLLKIFENQYMKRWLIHDYANSKEAFKMYKKILKSNNSDAKKKELNKMFVLRDLRLKQHQGEDEGSLSTSNIILSRK